MTLPTNLFLRDTRHREPLERGELPRLHHQGAGLNLFMGMGITLLTGLGMWTGLSTIGDGVALHLDGRPVEAAQTARRIVEGDGGRHYITYTYTIDGRGYSRESSVSRAEWEQFCQGCPISARYVADDPATSRIDTEWPMAHGLLVGALTGSFMTIGLAMSAAWWRERRRIGRMRSRGALRLGTILDVTTHDDSDNNLWVKLRYQIDGADATRSLEWMDNSLSDKLPAPGARLAIAYEAEDNLELL